MSMNRHLSMLTVLITLLCSTGFSFSQVKGGRGVALDDIITQLDTDKDGKVSKAEATGTFAQRFSPWDTNNDGFATREEIHAYRAGLGINDDGTRSSNTRPAGPARETTPAQVLTEPMDWRLETMTIPPGFAPEVKVKGHEEIRFAPGMFDSTSDTYFTCIIALTVDGAVGVAELKDFLEKYYRGLSSGRAQRSKVKVDPTQMIAEVKPVPDTKNRFMASIVFFDSFSDGRKIVLNIECSTFAQAAQTVVVLLVSPSAKDSKAWAMLREVGKKAEANAAVTSSAAKTK